MKKILFALAVCVTGLALASEAKALPPVYRPVGHARRVVVAPRPYAGHGIRYTGGYYYPGRVHSHWTSRVYSTRYGRYHYWDARQNCYYYYCPERCGYYPVEAAPY